MKVTSRRAIIAVGIALAFGLTAAVPPEPKESSVPTALPTSATVYAALQPTMPPMWQSIFRAGRQ